MSEPELRDIAAGPNNPEPNNDLSVVVVSLLRGVLEQEEKAEVWHALLNLQAAVRDYVAVLGLELVLDEAEGYAFLRSRPEDAEKTEVAIPRLVRRQPLAFPVSLLLHCCARSWLNSMPPAATRG